MKWIVPNHPGVIPRPARDLLCSLAKIVLAAIALVAVLSVNAQEPAPLAHGKVPGEGLGPADVVNAVREKPEVHLQLRDGESHFTRGGFAHVTRNLSDAPFRNVTIALLKPQGDVRNLCAQIVLDARRTGS